MNRERVIERRKRLLFAPLPSVFIIDAAEVDRLEQIVAEGCKNLFDAERQFLVDRWVSHGEGSAPQAARLYDQLQKED